MSKMQLTQDYLNQFHKDICKNFGLDSMEFHIEHNITSPGQSIIMYQGIKIPYDHYRMQSMDDILKQIAMHVRNKILHSPEISRILEDKNKEIERLKQFEIYFNKEKELRGEG